MSNAPQAPWMSLKLGETCTFIMGQAPKKPECNFDGIGNVFVKAGEFGVLKPVVREWTTNPIKNAEDQDILICVVGATAGKINLGTNCAIGRSVAAIRPGAAIDQIFLYRQMLSRVNELRKGSTGSAQGVVSKQDLYELEIPLPPLAEQKQIAAKLDELLAQVDTLKTRLDAIPAILKRFRQSVLAAAVSGRLTEEWRVTNETQDVISLVEKVNATKTGKLKVRVKKGLENDLNLYELPVNWAWMPNHKLAEDSSSAICAGPFGTIFKAKDFRSKGVPIIFLRHVKAAGFNQNKPNHMDQNVWAEHHQEYSVHGGELLITKLGDPPGESCIYPCGIGVAMVTPDVLKMSVDRRLAETNYLMYFFNSLLSKEMISELAFGATRLRIDIAMFKTFPIPTPPRDEQTEIVR